jgi:Holliday junction resolvase YEN1
MLIQGIQNHANDNVVFLASWRVALCEELRTNTSRRLSKCLPKLANSVPVDFPDLAIVQLYLAPRTTVYVIPPAVFVPAHGVDFASLAQFCERNFVWANAGGILRWFASYVFPGHAVRQLVKAAAGMDSGLVPDCSIFGSAVLENQYPGSRLPEIRITLKVRPTIDEILAAIWGEHDTTTTMAGVRDWVDNGFYVRATLPLTLVMHVLPQCVAEFRSRKKGQSHTVSCSLLNSSCFLAGAPSEPQAAAAAAQASLPSPAVEGV